MDRQALTLLVGPIRTSLGINDTQISLLHGFAFALFYTVMGIPIGQMVDRHRRTWVIAAGIVTWSVMTAACGLARNFLQMFFARIGVGIGEASLSPGAYSLIVDYFPPQSRTLALSIYFGAVYVGSGLALMIGGTLISSIPAMTMPMLGQMEPWQSVFIILGLPGVLVAILVLALKEPPRTGVASDLQPNFKDLMKHMRLHAGIFAHHFWLFAQWSDLVWLDGMVAHLFHAYFRMDYRRSRLPLRACDHGGRHSGLDRRRGYRFQSAQPRK